jgi:hypothetical protein
LIGEPGLRIRVLLTILLASLLSACSYWSAAVKSGDAAYMLGIRAPVNAVEFTPPGPTVGELAPDFELQDIQGNVVKLSDYRGRPVVLALGSYT